MVIPRKIYHVLDIHVLGMWFCRCNICQPFYISNFLFYSVSFFYFCLVDKHYCFLDRYYITTYNIRHMLFCTEAASQMPCFEFRTFFFPSDSWRTISELSNFLPRLSISRMLAWLHRALLDFFGFNFCDADSSMVVACTLKTLLYQAILQSRELSFFLISPCGVASYLITN